MPRLRRDSGKQAQQSLPFCQCPQMVTPKWKLVSARFRALHAFLHFTPIQIVLFFIYLEVLDYVTNPFEFTAQHTWRAVENYACEPLFNKREIPRITARGLVGRLGKRPRLLVLNGLRTPRILQVLSKKCYYTNSKKKPACNRREARTQRP